MARGCLHKKRTTKDVWRIVSMLYSDCNVTRRVVSIKDNSQMF